MSLTVLKKGAGRPEVFTLQEALTAVNYPTDGADGRFGAKTEFAVLCFQRGAGLGDDGEVGKGTWTRLLRSAKGYAPPLSRCCHSLVAYYETGNHQDAYGTAEADIGDNAGANYGVLQHNSFGSVNIILNMAGRSDLLKLYNTTDKSVPNPDVKAWFGEREGREAQNRYFLDIIWKRALQMVDGIPFIAAWRGNKLLNPFYERACMMMVDNMTQNGGLWSEKRKPFWASLTADEAQNPNYAELYYGKRWNALLGEYITYDFLKTKWFELEKSYAGNREKANREGYNLLAAMLPDAQSKLVLLAQWRARTSWEKYWTDVESRRMLDATGDGRVHGDHINLAQDFGIGVDQTDYENRDI